jgi:hypothetical protein
MMEIETRALRTTEVYHEQGDAPQEKGADRAHVHVLRMCAIQKRRRHNPSVAGPHVVQGPRVLVTTLNSAIGRVVTGDTVGHAARAGGSKLGNARPVAQSVGPPGLERP